MRKSDWLSWCRSRQACAPGLDEGERLFETGKTYELPDLMCSCMNQKHKLWLLATMAKDDPKALKLLRRWITECCEEMGVTKVDLRTEDSSRKALRTALRLKSREHGLQAARAWSDEKLQALAGKRTK